MAMASHGSYVTNGFDDANAINALPLCNINNGLQWFLPIAILKICLVATVPTISYTYNMSRRKVSEWLRV